MSYSSSENVMMTSKRILPPVPCHSFKLARVGPFLLCELQIENMSVYPKHRHSLWTEILTTTENVPVSFWQKKSAICLDRTQLSDHVSTNFRINTD